jgi:hypothetical protein
MQKIATRAFIYSSVAFGVLGIVIVLTGIEPNKNTSGVALVITKLFMSSIFVILTSFALSVATKFLNGRSS